MTLFSFSLVQFSSAVPKLNVFSLVYYLMSKFSFSLVQFSLAASKLNAFSLVYMMAKFSFGLLQFSFGSLKLNAIQFSLLINQMKLNGIQFHLVADQHQSCTKCHRVECNVCSSHQSKGPSLCQVKSVVYQCVSFSLA